MDWITTTARTVEEAQTRALDLLGVDNSDAEIQVLEEGKTGLFGRTKTEARVRARIKPKAPPAKEERRPNRDRNRNRGKGGGNRGGGGNNRNRGGNRDGGNRDGGNRGGGGNNRNRGGDKQGGNNRNSGNAARAAAAGGAGGGGGNRDGGNRGGGGRNRNRNRNRDRQRDDRGRNEDRVEMPIDEQRETLEAFVAGVAKGFDPNSKVTLVEEGTTLQAQVTGDDLGRLIGNKASTLQSLEELARTAMHRAAAGRRYHRIQVDVDSYRARRREALAKFATDLATQVADSGESKAMEPMGAADRKLIHDAVASVAGVETISEGRDPNRYIVLLPAEGAAGSDEEE